MGANMERSLAIELCIDINMRDLKVPFRYFIIRIAYWETQSEYDKSGLFKKQFFRVYIVFK